ncbi:GGDEF domain-containing protein [Nitrincola tapanii]|uniref:diguanylate cyclase n=1 Tax=Nitrincola tapanii TaxID=1708751 RepID=A0A5A9W3J0_9GAMM|nr:sensor domain-containing diguanylate cyclase [Nitrincola tapanii]KAA0875257.1 sensor domain-containing diguanylate cyclase [Nitrincola tapanii]
MNGLDANAWQTELLQTLDVGLIVLDRDFKVCLWNSFMVNHSGIEAQSVLGKSLFECFEDLPASWLKRKLDSVFMLGNRAFITWQERPWLFRFKSYRPFTGGAEAMYQNITLIPLNQGEMGAEHLGIMIYDMTDAALNHKALEGANDSLQALSRTDRLTELYNRGYWEECLAQEFQRFLRTRQTSTLVMLDIDHFKAINDNYGHQAGDEVIRQVAARIQLLTRTTDLCGRYGGEEFGILLVNTEADQAMQFAERLRLRIESETVQIGSQLLSITVSLGVAPCHDAQVNHSQWIEVADQALYRSKQTGRNRVTLADLDPYEQKQTSGNLYSSA